MTSFQLHIMYTFYFVNWCVLLFDRLRNSMENLVDATDPDSDIAEPLVTFPDPDTPPAVGNNDLPALVSQSPHLANSASQMLSSVNTSKNIILFILF